MLLEIKRLQQLAGINEVGSISNDIPYNPKQKWEDYKDVYKINFNVNGKKVEVTLSNNTGVSLEALDHLFNTNYNEEYKYTEINKRDDYIRKLPKLYQNIGEVSFDVDGRLDIFYKEREELTPDTQTYLQILSKVGGVVDKFIKNKKPNILILNRKSSDENNDENKQKNNIYSNYIKKFSPPNYTFKQKNDIIYLEKNSI